VYSSGCTGKEVIQVNGQEIERLLSIIQASKDLSREHLLAYIQEHRVRIMADLDATGEAEIPVPGGEKIVLRRAA
jgi:hypothetical protein